MDVWLRLACVVQGYSRAENRKIQEPPSSVSRRGQTGINQASVCCVQQPGRPSRVRFLRRSDSPLEKPSASCTSCE